MDDQSRCHDHHSVILYYCSEDLVAFDDAFGVLDPERADASERLGGFAHRLAAGIVETSRRLRDDCQLGRDAAAFNRSQPSINPAGMGDAERG